MDQDVTKKIGDILKGMDAGQIKQGKKTIEHLLKTPEGQKLKAQLGGMDKDKLMESFMQLNTDEIKRKLNKADLSSFSGKSAEEVLKKLR